jgi:hypothetical protein
MSIRKARQSVHLDGEKICIRETVALGQMAIRDPRFVCS